jgi:hypothetical protein
MRYLMQLTKVIFVITRDWLINGGRPPTNLNFIVFFVTGVVLSNASLDIAFHDRMTKDPNYISKFWVGLMDGDGSIQVNHWRYKYLQYRLVIKLKYCSENIKMLNLIETHIGGNVRIVDNNKFVIWVVNNKKEIKKIIKLFIVYPPITTRLSCQLAFMIKCFEKNNVDWYLNARNNKYFMFNNKILNINPSYFNEWLSGFIEAEGCFSIRNNSNNHSFSIGQNDDKYILDHIKKHFNISNQIRKINNRFWVVEVYRKSILLNIINHCIEYPLLGQKILSFSKFKDLFNCQT